MSFLMDEKLVSIVDHKSAVFAQAVVDLNAKARDLKDTERSMELIEEELKKAKDEMAIAQAHYDNARTSLFTPSDREPTPEEAERDVVPEPVVETPIPEAPDPAIYAAYFGYT